MEKASQKLLAFPSKSWRRRGRSQQSSSPRQSWPRARWR
jgi:hypothetical protein